MRRLARAILGRARKTMVERARPVRRIQPRQKVHHAGEGGQSRTPSSAPIAHPEIESGAKWHDRVCLAPLQNCDNGLGDDQRDVALQSVAKTLLVQLDGIAM